MGTAQSTNNPQTIQIEEEKKINIITHVEDNEEEIFNKISNLTKDILIKYSELHLDENFCNNLSIIYQEQLNTFKIKLLRDIYNKISGKKIQYELLLVNKYNDKNDDKFKVEDDLKIGIEELFFNQNIKFNPTYLSQIELFDPNIKIEDIFKKIFTNKKYIDDNVKFSDLLNDKSRFQRNKNPENNEKGENSQNNENTRNETRENNNGLNGGANNVPPFRFQQKQPFQKYTNKEKQNYYKLKQNKLRQNYKTPQ